MVHCKIHNVGFYNPDPRAIYFMAIQRESNRLAIARSDASIEIWNLSNVPYIERTIPPDLENFSIEGLCWLDNRLFSIGLHGFLVEYDLYQLLVKDKWVVTGEAATCLDIFKQNLQIAVGTEQGYINIFRITDSGAEFEKFLDKQEGRIVCIKFNTTGEFLVTGSLNAVRIWNINSGHAIHKMQIGRSEANRDTIVWCLEVMADFTIFSGDSRGILTLWDGKVGAQVENYQPHKADITALCISESEDSVYCAGVDPLITNYEKVKVGQSFKWVKSIQRRIHEHDIRAMIYHKNKLYSAGIDSYLACSFHPPKTLVKYPPVMQNQCTEVASNARLILLRHSRHIEIWSLAETESAKPSYRGIVELKTKPKKLVTLQRVNKNWSGEDEGEGIFCSCISTNGQWILISTHSGFRLYTLEIVKEKPKITKIDDLDDCNVPCVQAAFNNKYNQLVVALLDGKIVIYDLEDSQPFISQTIQRKGLLDDTVTFLTVSECGKYLVAGDPNSNIVIWSHIQDGYSIVSKLPKYSVPLTAISVNSLLSTVVVVYADGKIIEYDIKNKCLSSRSRILDRYMPASWKSRTHHVRSITFDPRRPDVILLGDDGNLTVITNDKKSEGNDFEKTPAKVKKANVTNGIDSVVPKVQIVQKYKVSLFNPRWANDKPNTIKI